MWYVKSYYDMIKSYCNVITYCDLKSIMTFPFCFSLFLFSFLSCLNSGLSQSLSFCIFFSVKFRNLIYPPKYINLKFVNKMDILDAGPGYFISFTVAKT